MNVILTHPKSSIGLLNVFGKWEETEEIKGFYSPSETNVLGSVTYNPLHKKIQNDVFFDPSSTVPFVLCLIVFYQTPSYHHHQPINNLCTEGNPYILTGNPFYSVNDRDQVQ